LRRASRFELRFCCVRAEESHAAVRVIERLFGRYHLLARRGKPVEMHPRDSVYAARDRAHDAPPGTGVRRLQIVGNSPYAEEGHLRFNPGPKGPEVVKEFSGAHPIPSCKLEDSADDGIVHVTHASTEREGEGSVAPLAQNHVTTMLGIQVVGQPSESARACLVMHQTSAKW
jgi:hypothetical protein